MPCKRLWPPTPPRQNRRVQTSWIRSEYGEFPCVWIRGRRQWKVPSSRMEVPRWARKDWAGRLEIIPGVDNIDVLMVGNFGWVRPQCLSERWVFQCSVGPTLTAMSICLGVNSKLTGFELRELRICSDQHLWLWDISRRYVHSHHQFITRLFSVAALCWCVQQAAPYVLSSIHLTTICLHPKLLLSVQPHPQHLCEERNMDRRDQTCVLRHARDSFKWKWQVRVGL